MKLFVAAAFLVLAASGAYAEPLSADASDYIYRSAPGVHPHDVCHGRASGTSDPACGQTLTGGPAGSLF